jgi:hypothetical protein
MSRRALPSSLSLFLMLGGVTASIGEAAAAETAEVHVQVCDATPSVFLAALDLDKSQPERRKVYYFDTASLGLYDQGIVLRAIDVKGGELHLDAKLRPADAQDLSERWDDEDGWSCEVDAYTDRTATACRLRDGKHDLSDLNQVLDGSAAPQALFSHKQGKLTLLEREVDLADQPLEIFGPGVVARYKLKAIDQIKDVTVEVWEVDEDRVVLELSTRVDLGNASAARAAFRTALEHRGLDVCAHEVPKVESILDD